MSIPDPTDPRAVVDDPSGIVQQMPDENNTPEMPDRIWAWSEDDDFLRAKPHGVMHGTEYIRADRAAPEGQVQCCMCGRKDLSTVEGDGGEECQLWDGRWTCSRGCYDKACMIHEAALTPPPAAPTDNTALVGAAKAAVAAWLEDGLEVGRTMLKLSETLDALASREAPPACQQEAVGKVKSIKVLELTAQVEFFPRLNGIEPFNVGDLLYAHPAAPAPGIAEALLRDCRERIVTDADAFTKAGRLSRAIKCDLLVDRIDAALRALKGGEA